MDLMRMLKIVISSLRYHKFLSISMFGRRLAEENACASEFLRDIVGESSETRICSLGGLSQRSYHS